MPTPKPDPSTADQLAATDDGTVTVEAPTTQEAMEAVTDRLGPRATIVRADRVLRGGVGGFFGKQMVQLTAAPAGADHAATASATTEADRAADEDGDLSPGEPTDAGDGLDAALKRLTADADGREEAFGDALRRHLRAGEVADECPPSTGSQTPMAASAAGGATATAAAAAPAPAPAPETAPAPTAAPRTVDHGERRGSAPRWSTDQLHRLRLPDRLIEQVVLQSPVTDQDWLLALADAVDPLCRPLPAGDVFLVGPHAATVGEQLGLPVWQHRQRRAPTVGPLAASACDIPADAAALEEARGERWVHLLISGSGRVEHLTRCEPLAVSWVGDAALPEALDLCSRFGLVLGYGSERASIDAVPHRAAPLDVAIAVRRRLSR